MKRLALLALALACAAAYVAYVFPWTLDDAFIYMRYAQNLAAGHGPVYNPGERCEGYSSFLWIVLLAVGRLLGGDLPVLAKTFAGLFAAGCIVLVHQAWRFVPEVGRTGSAGAAVLLGTCTAFTPWATAGMETPLLALELTLLVLWWLRTRRFGAPLRVYWALGLLGGLATMTRPEGLLTFGLIAVDAVVRDLRAGRARGLALPAGFALVFVPWFAWRLAYYGDPLPNTYYAKVGHTVDTWLRGARYLLAWLVPAGPLLLAALLGLRRTRRARVFTGLPVLAAAWTAYVVWVGGDFMPAFRFLAPITPLLCVVAARGLQALTGTLRAGAWVLVPLWGLAASEVSPKIGPFIRHDEVVPYARAVGSWIRENTPEDAVIAVNAAGALPFYAERRAIDMLGLNDRHIAHRQVPDMGKQWAGHEKGDGRYVFERAPDCVLFGTFGETYEPRYLSGKEMYGLPNFLEHYALQTWPLDVQGTRLKWPGFCVWVRIPK